MHKHLLTELSLPDRYERLEQRLGPDVAKLLVTPQPENIDSLHIIAADVATRDEGVLVPVFGGTGVGKTTFVDNASQWLPTLFTQTCSYNGKLTFDDLTGSVVTFSGELPINNRRIIPINIDHRENSPPTDEELSAIKRFLRTNGAGVPCIILWPETSSEIADSISKRYTSIAGQAAIPLPFVCKGPPRDAWRDIIRHTLTLANRVDNLHTLGVDPHDYDVNAFSTLGEFIRKVSQDFNKYVLKLRSELEKPIKIVIAFASESGTPGVLSQLTSPSRYGLLDAHALISVTSQSVIGRWWADRRGLLTRTIVQLDAHAICLAPTAAASCVRNFSDSMPLFDNVGYRRYGPGRGVRDLGRSDLGKIVAGEKVSRFESRGTPLEDASAAFSLLAENGFNLGKDKGLNGIMRQAIEALLKQKAQKFDTVESEKKLPFCPIIPDNSIFAEDVVTCVEYTWRTGDFLASGNRSAVAQYVLTKLRNYARELGWTND